MQDILVFCDLDAHSSIKIALHHKDIFDKIVESNGSSNNSLALYYFILLFHGLHVNLLQKVQRLMSSACELIFECPTVYQTILSSYYGYP